MAQTALEAVAAQIRRDKKLELPLVRCTSTSTGNQCVLPDGHLESHVGVARLLQITDSAGRVAQVKEEDL